MSVNFSLDDDGDHVFVVGDESNSFLEVLFRFALRHEAGLELRDDSEDRTFITHRSLPLFFCGEILGFRSELSVIEENVCVEAVIFVLFPVNFKLVHVDADGTAVLGGRHPILAEHPEDTSLISLSHRGLNFHPAEIVQYFHVLEEGVGVSILVPDDEVLSSLSSSLTLFLQVTHSTGSPAFNHFINLFYLIL